MRRQKRRGVSSIEFAFGTLILVPLLLGTGVTGINMIKTLQVVQVARDAGHMYARNVDFGLVGNKGILVRIGKDVGLKASGGNAAVILSALTYVDEASCTALGLVDAMGKPTAACTNYGYWVFTQRIVVGNASVRSSNFGTPDTGLLDSVTGKITMANYVKKVGARSSFTAMNPYSVTGTVVKGVPSGQLLFLSEAAAKGFNMPPFVSGAVAYSYGLF